MARLKFLNTARTPWSYRAGTTKLHRCPAAIKLILLLLLSTAPILGFPFAAGAAVLIVFIGALSAKLSFGDLFSGARPLLILLLLFALFRSLRFGEGQNALNLFFITVNLDPEAFLNGLYLTAGILLCFAAASLFFAVTTTAEIKRSLSKIEFIFTGKQGRLSLGLALMLGFLPRFFECWENAVLAVRARCCAGRLKQVVVILPLVTERMLETASDTAEALESRGLEL